MTTTVDIGLSIEDAQAVCDILADYPNRRDLTRARATIAVQLALTQKRESTIWPVEPCLHGEYGCEASSIDAHGVRVHPAV